MPTKPKPEDLFDFDAWIGRPPLAAVTVTPTGGATHTLVLRANDVDDFNAVRPRLKGLDPELREDRFAELMIARCTVAIVPGDTVDLDAVVVGEQVITGDGVHKLRRAIHEAQWARVCEAMKKASFTIPEPTVPSSPES